jgi:hypothetical protein
MNNKLGDAMAIIMPVLGVVITIFADIEDKVTKFVLLGILLAFALGYSIFTTLKGNKNLSNTQVIDKSRRYTKHLQKLVKTNAKVMAKDFNLTELAETKKKIGVVTKKINRSYASNRRDQLDKYIAEKDALMDKYYDQSHGYADAQLLDVNKPIKNMVALANYEESQKVFNLIYGTIKDMERILLQLEQHELRVKLGKYVVKYSTDIDKTIHAYVDYLGWTYVLLDKNKKGFQAIQNGINLIDYKINTSKAGHEKYCQLKKAGEEIPEVIQKQHVDYCEYTLQKARALRHLGTTYYTYRSFKDNFVKESYKKEKLEKNGVWSFENTVNPYVKIKLAEGLALMEEESIIEYFSETLKKRETYSKMVFGIKYNDLLYDYYVALYKNDQSIETYVHINNQLNALIEEIDKSEFKDNHRLIKILTLKNQLKHKIYNQQDDNGVKIEGADEWDKLLAKDLKTIESVLNQNIYFDEAMEVYVCQKVRKLYTDIEKVFEN